MSNGWTREEDGIGAAEPKMSSVAFCLLNSFSSQNNLRNGLSVPVYPSQHWSRRRLRHHRQWYCLFLVTAVRHAVGRRRAHPWYESEFQKDMDLLPPRYAIESDDEDEFNPLHPNRSPDPEIKIKITGNVAQNVNLVIATGIAGNTWARGAKLGEQSGQVSVNGVQVL